MIKMRVTFAVGLLLAACVVQSYSKGVVVSRSGRALTQDEMRVVLQDYTEEGSLLCNKLSLANWDVQTHVNEEEYPPIQV